MKKLYILSLLVSLFAFTACNSTNEAGKEKVSFNSMLDGAQVYVDGEFVGETPCVASLCVNSSHEVKFIKEGFKAEIYTLSPTPAVPVEQLGTLVGDYPKTLSPANVVVEMKPELLPIVPGKTAFETYTENYVKVDALRKFDAISQAEYEYIVKYMQEFYGQED
ncbi:MAG: PEGA domain-containing protein [Opitutales bacterium]